jgi:predicted dehydrogenase
MKRLRVAIVGIGYWGPKIARTVYLNPNCDLVAVSDLNVKLAQTQLNKMGISELPIVRNFEDLASFDIDIVVIAVPPQLHIQISNYFLVRKIHVLIEKPFGLSQMDREATVALARQHNVRVFVDHTYLFSPEFSSVKEIVQSGEIGPLNFYTSSRVNLGLLQESTNVVEDLMIHDLAILDSLTGNSPMKVSCIGSVTKPSLQTGTAFASLIYENGFVANLSASWHSPVKIRQIDIVGQTGAITWNDTSGADKIKIYSSRIEKNLTPEDFRISYHLGDGRIPRIGSIEPLAKQFQDIYVELSGQTQPGFEFPIDESHALRTGQTLEAITKSLKIGEPVNVR